MRQTFLLLFFGIWILFFPEIINAQFNKGSIKPKVKIIQDFSYQVKEGELIERNDVLNSNNYTSIFKDTNGYIIDYYNSTLSLKTFYERNKSGLLIKMITKSLQELKYYSIYEYDTNNNPIFLKKYDLNDNLIYTESNKFDKKNNNIEKIITNVEKKTSQKHIYVYNDRNKKIEHIQYKPDGNIKLKQTFYYNKKGKEIKQLSFSLKGSSCKLISKYNKMNHLAVLKWFNEEGEQIKEISFEYFYNKYGDVITQKKSVNGVLNTITERLIEYY